MKRCFIFLLLNSSFFPLFAFAQADWYKKSATPGAGLTATLNEHESISAASKFTYYLKASGFPAGANVSVLITNLAAAKLPDADPAGTVKNAYDPAAIDQKIAGLSRRVREPLMVDENGRVLYLDGTIFGVGFSNPVPGESFVVSLVTSEKKLKIGAFVRITPVPIEVKDGSCSADAVLMASAGAAYEIYARGFPAREQALVSWSIQGKVRESKIKADQNGAWNLNIQTARDGKSYGTLTANISGPSCKLILLLPFTPHN
jgi:hypothetical protein